MKCPHCGYTFSKEKLHHHIKSEHPEIPNYERGAKTPTHGLDYVGRERISILKASDKAHVNFESGNPHFRGTHKDYKVGFPKP